MANDPIDITTDTPAVTTETMTDLDPGQGIDAETEMGILIAITTRSARSVMMTIRTDVTASPVK